MKTEYPNFQGFENIFLEDSFVLKIKTSENLAEFLLEIILTEKHQMYSKPKPNEAYCYKKAIISFSNVENIVWVEVNMCPNIDIDGEVDFGNIDSFFYEDNFYNISGDWGKVKIQSQNPTIKLIN